MSINKDRITRDQLFAHDLRNPLTAVRVLAQMLAEDVPEELQEDVEDILEAADLAIVMVDGFSDSTIYCEGQAQTRVRQPMDLGEIVVSVAERSAFRKKLELGVLDAARVGASSAAERVIAQVLYNGSRLLGPDKKLQVSVEMDGSVRVLHPHLSLAPADLLELLQPYGAVALKARRLRAAPLGLHHCKRMMESLGGTLFIENTPPGLLVRIQFSIWSAQTD